MALAQEAFAVAREDVPAGDPVTPSAGGPRRRGCHRLSVRARAVHPTRVLRVILYAAVDPIIENTRDPADHVCVGRGTPARRSVVGVGDEAITGTTARLDIARVRGVVAEFIAQAIDEDLEIVGFIDVVAPPDPFEQGAVGYDLSSVPREDLEQQIFGRRQIDDCAIDPNLTRV